MGWELGMVLAFFLDESDVNGRLLMSFESAVGSGGAGNLPASAWRLWLGGVVLIPLKM